MDDSRVRRIVEWRESVATLPDGQFFELMRMYLGGLSSPFNKQKLIEELGAFLRNEENRRKIASLLDRGDIQVVAAVRCIGGATVEKLAQFFDGEMTHEEICGRASNLEERLVLYRRRDGSERTELCVNPHLDDVLEPLAVRSVLLGGGNVASPAPAGGFRLSPELMAAFVSFVHSNPDLCKADGSFKKRALSEMESVFGGICGELQLLKDALENLGVLVCGADGRHSVDRAKLAAFARLPAAVQQAYVCVTARGRASRSALGTQARLLVQSALAVPPCGFSRPALVRLAWLLGAESDSPLGPGGRFSQMVGQRISRFAAPAQASDEPPTAGLSRLVDSAVRLGFFRLLGTEEDGTEIFGADEGVVGGAFRDESVRPRRGGDPGDEPPPKVLSIDAAFTVMLFPGLPLDGLVPLVDFLEIRRFDTAVSFEITRRSAMRAFDLSLTDGDIAALLGKSCAHELPQNLLVQLEDWRRDYGAASLYSGFVLRASPDDAALSLRNPRFARHVVETIAPGVFLLDVEGEQEARRIVAAAGADYVGRLRTAARPREVAEFPPLLVRRPSAPEESLPEPPDEAGIAAHLERLRAALDSMTLSREERECLLFRINRRVVLSERQLRADSVKFSRLEASGMDFSGKVHIIEQSIDGKIPVEMTFPSPPPNGIVVTGVPVSMEKSEDDVLVTVRPAGTNVMQTYSVSRATRVRQVYSSKF